MRFLFLYVLLLFLLTSCIWNDEPFEDFYSSAPFVHLSTGEAFTTTYNSTLYHDFAFTSDGLGNICVYNIIDSHNPVRISETNIPTSGQRIHHIAVDWRYNLYTASGTGGFQIVSATNLYNLFTVFTEPNVYALDLSYQDDYFVVIDRFGWKLFYMLNANSPSEINSYYYHMTQRQPYMILLRGSWVYAFSLDRLDIFDITNVYNIRLEVSIPLNSTFIDYTMMENFLVIACQFHLHIVDISRPLQAYNAHIYSLNRTTRTIAYNQNNGYLYFSWIDRSIWGYKVNSISNLVKRSEKDFTQSVFDIQFRGTRMYMSNGSDGLGIYEYVP
jgi:hypothetical protein